MGALDKLKSMLPGSKNPEQEALEQERKMQEQQLEIQKRISPVEAAQSMALMKNATDSGQYELGALALDPIQDIEEFKSQLRGFRWVPVEDKTGNVKYVKDVFGTAAMSDDGINYISNSLRFYTSKTFTLTNYTGKERGDQGKLMISSRCKIAGTKIAAMLALNRRTWNIDPVKRSTIVDQCENFIEASLSRSLDMKTAQQYFGTQKTLTHINQQTNPDAMQKKPTGWFGGN